MQPTISILLLSLVFFSCTPKGTETRTDIQIKSDRRQAEQQSPTMYLNVTGQIAEDRINCSIENLATEASYTNIVIGVNYFTEHRELIRSDVHTINQVVAPSSIATYTLAIAPPPLNYATISISTRGAEGVN